MPDPTLGAGKASNLDETTVKDGLYDKKSVRRTDNLANRIQTGIELLLPVFDYLISSLINIVS